MNDILPQNEDRSLTTGESKGVTGMCWIIERVSNETNEDVRMYTCRIYSSRDLDTLLYKVELNNIGRM